MTLERVENIASSSVLLGFSGKIVESRLTPVDDRVDGANHVLKHQVGPHYAAKDAMEAVADLTVQDAIIPMQIDKDFQAYLGDVFNHRPNVHGVDVTRFDTQTAEEILKSYNESGPVVHYGMWTMPKLPDYLSLIPADDQKRANAKSMLSKVFTDEAVPPQLILQDPRKKGEGKTIFEATQVDLDEIRNGYDKLWLKAGDWGLGGEGVVPGKDLKDLLDFYRQLVDLGVDNAEIILEQHVPGEGGSFCVIKRVDGKVQFSHITKQLSDTEGKRLGNIIFEIDKARPQMKVLVERTGNTLAESDLPPGFYTFDTLDTKDGRSLLDDPANRKTGTTPTAYQRMYLVNNMGLSKRDTVTGMQRLYLNPNTHFSEVIKAFQSARLTEWKNGRIITFRQFLNAYGRASFHLALTTNNAEQLPEVEEEVVHALKVADIDNSPKPF